MFKRIILFLLPVFFTITAHAAEIAGPRTPAENDVLIKHYMDTKNPEYLRAMLETYAKADDTMLHDARRYAYFIPLTQNPEDPKNPRPNLAKTAAVALCQKYNCSPNPAASPPFMQVMTISSGMWALGSLSRQDPQIKKIVEEFLVGNERMRQIYAEEGLHFSNYMTLTVIAKIQPGKIDEQLTKYEQFQPLELEAAMKSLEIKPATPVTGGPAPDHALPQQ